LAIDRMTLFKYGILGLMAAISAIGAFIDLFFPKEEVIAEQPAVTSS
jgi:hypothetical protein